MSSNKDLSKKQIVLISVAAVVAATLGFSVYWLSKHGLPTNTPTEQESKDSAGEDKPDSEEDEASKNPHEEADEIAESADESLKDGDDKKALEKYQSAQKEYKKAGSDEGAATMQTIIDEIENREDSETIIFRAR